MQMLRWSLLLFGLNLMDALLTIVWVRNGVATEGNALMANLLDIGDAPFLSVKVAVGFVTVVVLARYGSLKIARYGLSIALGAYAGLMIIHLATGMAAFGYRPEVVVDYLRSLSMIDGAAATILT
jgi:hypothetical protein